MFNYIFVVNDIPLENETLKAETIVDILLKQKIWLLNRNTPNLRWMKSGDKVILYLAGKGRRYFYCTFELGESIVQHNKSSKEAAESYLYEFFELEIPIKNIEYFNPKVYISEIKETLDFIVDKKNYGLYFRQSTKIIDGNDFEKIINMGTTTKINENLNKNGA